MDKYDEKAALIFGGGPQDHRTLKKEVAAFGRECAASAFEEAASDVECLNSKYQPAFIRDKECQPCDDCVQGARLRGKAAAIRAPVAKTEEKRVGKCATGECLHDDSSWCKVESVATEKT